MNLLSENKTRKRLSYAGGAVFVVAATIVCILGTYLPFLSLLMDEDDFIFKPDTLYLSGVLNKLWAGLILLVIFAGVGLLLALIFCGSFEKTERRISLNWFDRIFSEVQIIAGICFGSLFVPGEELLYNWIGNGSSLKQIVVNAGGKTVSDIFAFQVKGEWVDNPFAELYLNPSWVEGLLAILLIAVAFSIEIALLVALVKKLKARAFWQHSAVGKVFYHFQHAFRVGGVKLWKVLGVCILLIALSATMIGIIPAIIAVCYFVPKWMNKYQALKDGLEEVRKGNLAYEIGMTEEEDGELGYLAEGIEAIAGAQKTALDNELRTQRLRTDLISNVSHDLKTPLTSMISYVDLMKKEGVDGEHAEEYLQIIDEKTCRLQKLTEDLFEAAKASSGDMPVNLEEVDMCAIINQALAEVGDRLSVNDIEVVFNNTLENTEVAADGRLLWRVIENLLTNVGKYAMPHTRVYLDLTKIEGSGVFYGEPMVRLEVKNTSREALNIGTDELMERFTRGDESRNTDGSGLGLSIARDLTKLMNGRFDIVIDGDLFKAVVDLPVKL